MMSLRIESIVSTIVIILISAILYYVLIYDNNDLDITLLKLMLRRLQLPENKKNDALGVREMVTADSEMITIDLWTTTFDRNTKNKVIDEYFENVTHTGFLHFQQELEEFVNSSVDLLEIQPTGEVYNFHFMPGYNGKIMDNVDQYIMHNNTNHEPKFIYMKNSSAYSAILSKLSNGQYKFGFLLGSIQHKSTQAKIPPFIATSLIPLYKLKFFEAIHLIDQSKRKQLRRKQKQGIFGWKKLFKYNDYRQT